MQEQISGGEGETGEKNVMRRKRDEKIAFEEEG
jgi:hypothetical protein